MKETHIPTPPANSDPDEIDLLALAKTLWNGRRIVLKSMLICGAIGFLVALTTPNEYEATTVIVPSGGSGSSNLGGLGGLAAMAGINIGSQSSSELSPTVYPQILTSLPYQLELMETPLNVKGLKTPVSLVDYYTEIQKPNLLRKYTIGLPGIIMRIPGVLFSVVGGNEKKGVEAFENKSPIELTVKQQSGRGILSGIISLTVNTKTGTLTLSAKMPEARAAAQLGQRAQELLQQYIIEFRIKKTKANLDFIQQRFDETAKKFEDAQQRVASFSDRNKNVSLATAKIDEVRLTSQYNLIFSIYSELAKQLEQAKIQVKQDTPIFTIIEPVSVPTTRSKPDRTQIIIFWLFLGGIFGIFIAFGKGIIVTVKKKWKEKVVSS